MKIVFVLPDMPGGGSERVVALLANEYVRRGYEVSILLFAGRQTAYPLDERVEMVITGEESGGNPLIRLRRLAAMRRYYRQNQGCYIFSFCVMGTVFSVLAAAGLPHRMLVSERNDPTRIPHQRLRNWAYRRAEKLIVQTEGMKSCFPGDIQEKSAVIPNPVSPDIPKAYRGERTKRIVNVAGFRPQKNHRLLLEAFADFHEGYPEYELQLFGIGGLEEELKAQAVELGIADRVNFKGFSGNVMEEIRDAAMFVLSSDYEGISNSMIEALAMGVPVISTDCPVGGARMYIEDGVSGLLVPVGDRKRMAEAMKKIAASPDLSQRLSQKGSLVRENYSLEKIASRFLLEAGLKQYPGR